MKKLIVVFSVSLCLYGLLLRSSHIPTAKYVKHTTRTKLGERAFSYAGPAALNALPASLHDITDINQ